MKLALLGDPVAHSLSPALHGAAFRSVGLTGTYGVQQVARGELAAALDAVRRGDIDGVNVTMPHKRRAAELVDTLDPAATATGAVNTITRLGRRLTGHNTDVAGVKQAATWANLPDHAPVLVLGAGGAAAAALQAFRGRDLLVSARREDASRRLADATGAETVAWGDAVPASVVVNATPLGMRGETLPQQILEAAVGVFDMAYGTEPTKAVATCRRAGIPVVEGADMLLFQAVRAFELWTGRRPDPEAMRAAMVEELRGRRTTG